MSSFTRVTTMQIPNKHNWYLLFGSPVRTDYLHSEVSGARLTVSFFCPGAVFGYSVQKLNPYGIVQWNTYFCRAIAPNQPAHDIGIGIEPAAECLIPFPGTNKSRLAQSYLSLLERYGLDPTQVPELHKRSAPFLLSGVLPTELVRSHAFSYAKGIPHGC